MKHSFFVLMTAFAVLFGPLIASTAVADARGAKIVFLTLTDDCAYCAMHRSAFLDKAGQLGLHVEVRSTDFDANVQAAQVEWAIAQSPDAIVLWPAEAKAIETSLRKIHETGIPLVLTNSKPDDAYQALWNVYTGPNDIRNGELAAEAMVRGFEEKKSGVSGRILLIEGEPGSVPQIDRTAGFERVLTEMAPGIEIVGKGFAAWSKADATEAASGLFARFGADIQGVYAQADDMLAGVIVAAQDAGLDPGELVLVGSNCTIEGVEAIEAGIQYASVLQSPIDDGHYAAQAVADVLDGKTLEKDIFLPHVIVTRQNVSVCDHEGNR